MIFQAKARNYVLCFFLLTLFTSTIFAQSFPERSEKTRLLVENGEFNSAVTELKAARQADTPAFVLNNYDYLLARLLERTGDRAASTASYQEIVTRHSLLSEYALWHLAKNARASGDLVFEREQLRRLNLTAPNSLLRDAATMRLAESFLESADYKAAVSTLQQLTESKNASLARQALTLSGQASQRAGDSAAARDVFTKLITKMPDSSRPDDFALEAARGLDGLDGAEPGKLSEAEHLQRAAIYQFNRDFEHARLHYLAVVENNPPSASLAEVLYQLGRGLYQEEKYVDALKYLQRVGSSDSASLSVRDAMALIAGIYSRQKRVDDAVGAYQQVIERFPAAPNPERPYLNIIDLLRDAGRNDEALSWIKRTRERFKDQLGGTLALFAQAKIHIALNSWRAAATELNELGQAQDLGGARVPGGTTASEVSFLRAFALEQAGRTQEAIDSYLLIPEGRNEYYGFRANEHLRGLAADISSGAILSAKADALRRQVKDYLEGGQPEAARREAQAALRVTTDPTARIELTELVKRSYAGSTAYKFPSFNLISLGRQKVLEPSLAMDTLPPSHQALADELLFLRLYDEGVPEIIAARSDRTTPTNNVGATQNKTTPLADTDYTLAVYSLRGELPYPAVRFAEQVWRSIPSDYLIELAPRQMVEMLYPAPYRPALTKEAVPRKLDPRFVLSIARQETRFQAEAKSVAAARGLMQFIAATATDTAKELGRKDFRQDDLYNPETAIEFGSQYLASLFQRFPDQPQAVAASYNGGADNVERWVARSRSNDPDRYVPEIGFSQSKDYVLRVLSNYWVYQKFYDATLRAQQ